MAQDSENAHAFARRLVELMRVKGHTSDRSLSGVDVAALSKAAGVSYEMARRYAEGNALPRPDTVEAIARWLNVPAAALAWGGPLDGDIDQLLLEQVLQAVSEAQEKSKVSLEPGQIARIAAQLYSEAKAGQRPNSSALSALLRAFFNAK